VHTALVISPHADDAAAFAGGTLAKFAASGWRIVLVRITDDCKDSVGLTLEETRRINTEELHAAARIMGIAEIVELGYETDCLADVSEVELRERIIYLFRKHRPYAVFSFDPFDPHENNMDHIRVAQAVNEAFWVSTFDLHHPEHFEEGLEPFAVCESWFFGRELPNPTHVEDVTDTIETKIAALSAHRTMMIHMLNQQRLKLQTWGRRIPLVEECISEGDPTPFLSGGLRRQAEAVARAFEMEEGRLGEAYRLERFGGLEGLFQSMSEPIPGATPGPVRPGLDQED
jgi:LmbE family N-acetylglucosaminyl deacetylase